MKIKNEVLTILSDCEIKENLLFLPPTQLERKMYVEVNKILELMGGKWNRKEKAHLFSEDPTDLLETVLLTAEITDKKKEFQFFETPENIVWQMIELLELKETDNVLEPSAGQGAIIDVFMKNKDKLKWDGCSFELNPDNYKVLLEKGYKTKCVDFLTVGKDNFDAPINKIIMNPPFSKNQDIIHIGHAYELLKENGILVSVVSEHPFFANDKLSQGFRQFLEETNAEIIKLPEGAFKESGTMVNTRIIKVVK